ncbi:MAG: helix-turn-helix domain-containing protein [Bacteroidia bacterium]|jgi:YesN/AraC family two-component response regulator
MVQNQAKGLNMATITEEFKIKGMICSRCLKVLNTELKGTGAEVVDIHLGKIVIRYNPDKIKKSLIKQTIEENEFEIIWDKESVLAEQIKRWVINYIWNTDQQENLSDYLAKKLNSNYDYLSKMFSKTFGKTIERYSILLKMERTKEFIENGDLSFSEIAYALGYQNLSALSRLFKRETGMTLKEYKNLGVSRRIPIDKI